MILKCKISSGFLDISSQEGVESEQEPFRLTMRPGQVVTVQDKWRKLKNINSAINAGLLEVISYDPSPGVEVIQDKASKTVATLDGTKDPGNGYTFSLGNHKHDGGGSGGGSHHTLSDMPDTLGSNSDHDARYAVHISNTEPTVPTPFVGMLWLDTSA